MGFLGLHDAIQANNYEVTKRILNSYHYGSETILSGLYYATYKGYKKICELLIDHGADVNAPIYYKKEKDVEYGESLLMLASEKGHKDICELFILKDARLDYSNPHKGSALTIATINGHNEICKLLIEKGAR